MRKMKKWLTAGLTAALCLSLPGCANGPDSFGAQVLAQAQAPRSVGFDDYEAMQQIRQENPVEPALYGSVNAFCCEMTARVAAGEQNALFSPLSLYYALALTACGARGETERELLGLLNGGAADAAAQPDALHFAHGVYLPDRENAPGQEQPGALFGTGELTAGGSVQVFEAAKAQALFVLLPDGETAWYTFACGEYDGAALAAQLGNLYRLLYSDNGVSTLKIENALWLGRGTEYRDAFLTSAAALYASVYGVDFSDAETGRAMDAWLRRAAGGQFGAGFVPDPELVMSLFSTILFRGEWLDRFDSGRTQPGRFTCADGTEKTADFMQMQYGSHLYTLGEGYTRSALSLKGAGEMVFILPDEGISCAALLADAGRVYETFFGGQDNVGEVIWQLPKFDFQQSVGLNEALREAGVRQMLSPQADFSGMTDAPLWADGVTQQTHISIDERGVQAAAFTRIDYAGAAPPDGRAEMILNRPFIYGIVANGTLLFVGVCGDPTAA